MNAEFLSGKIISTDWKTSTGRFFDWKNSEAISIAFKNSAENLPSQTGGAVSGQANTGAGNATAPNPVRRHLRILMVEDSVDDCDLICYRLEKCGYTLRVQRVLCEAEMRAALEQDQWDILFTDHALPGFSGLHAIELLRRMGVKIPVLCITGTHDPAILRQVLAAGARTCVSKDDLSLLCTSVERALSVPENS